MKDMDRILKAKLYDHGSQLPSDLWSKIETGLNEDKKRRGFGWIWFGAIAFVLIAGFTAYQYTSALSGENSMVSVSSLAHPSLLSNVVHKPLESAPSEATVNISEQSSLPDQKLTINTAVSSEEIKVDPELSKIDHETFPSSIDNDEVSDTASRLTEEKATETEDELILSNTERSKIDLKSKNILSFDPRVNIVIPLLINDERSFKDPIGCPSFSNRYKANIFVEGYYQPLFAYSMLTSNSPEIGDDYLTLRRDSESRLYSWSAGVNVGWISDYNVGVKAGAEYEVINERFTYEDPAAIRNQTIIVIDTVFNNDGTFTVSMDTSTVQVSGSEIQQIANSHKTLSIPVHALYQINFKDFAFEISGGPIFNISYWNRGKIVDPSNEDQWFTNGESGNYNVYKNRLSVSFSLSVGALYSLNENIQLFAKPQVKYTPTSISRNGSPFNQKYLNTGLSLGARYYFSGNPNY